MRYLWQVCLLVVVAVCGSVSTAHVRAGQSSTGEKYAGTWAGAWDGAGSGEFELTLEKSKEGPVTGKVAVTTDGGNYNAVLKAVSFDGSKMTAKYDFPLDPSSEVTVAATFEDRTAKGTWSLRPKGQDAEIAGGTWTVTRK
jgi:hypothetical protein